jgi:3-oxoacyl-[acyl-carrier-protein] synthase-3
MHCRVIGVGSHLPSRIVTNEELGPMVHIRPQRIEELFSIRERRWVRGPDAPTPAEGQHCSDLGAEAARRAIQVAHIDPATIDTLVTVSTTPDFITPSLDYLVGAKLGLRDVIAFDLRAACAGLFRAVVLVDSLVRAGRCQRALIVAAEAISPFFRFGPEVPKDHRLNTVLYADGAGALLLERTDDELVGIQGVLARTTGDLARPGVAFSGILSAMPPTAERFHAMDYLGYHDFHVVLARGGELTRQAAEEMARLTGTTVDDYKFFVTHQATGNLRRIGAQHGIPPDRMPTNIERVGNTVGASILILLDELARDGALQQGDKLLLFTAESSTWSYGSMALVWG